MKKILPLLLVLFSFISKAQIVNIPDAHFKSALLMMNPPIDVNLDGEIQVSEAEAVTLLDISNDSISDLTGIKSFTNLHSLHYTANLFDTLDLSGMVNLTSITSTHNDSLVYLNISNCPALLSAGCIQSLLTNFDITGDNNLTTLSLDYNHLTFIDINGFPNLYSVSCRNNNITSLSVTNCPSLVSLSCNQNQLTGINISGLDTLQLLSCNQNLITSLHLNGFNNLTQLSCGQNLLTDLDVSGCTSLNYMDCSYNPLLKTLNLKNGPTAITYLGISNDPALQYVCVDDAEVDFLLNFLWVNFGISNLNINSYCSFVPGGPYNSINGTLRNDTNNNGCDGSDPAVTQFNIKIDDGTQTGTTQTISNGTYSFNTGVGNFTITPQPQNNYYNFSPASTSVNFATTGVNSNTNDFCFTANGNHPDLDISLIPITAARPGFYATYQLVYSNPGTNTQSGNIVFNFDNTRIDNISANPVAIQSSGSLNWPYSNLQPFETRFIIISLRVLPPPANNFNDTLTFTGNITPVAGDETPVDNNFQFDQHILGSFDPNDKTCLEGKFIDISKIGDYVHYVIRFQNTGNDTAFNVVVKDVLSDKFDRSSLQLIKSSHPCVLKQTGNKLEFIFEGINLPPQTVNDASSNGFIAFKIKTINTIAFRDSLVNNAAIYFDYNLPVITNDAITIVDSASILPIATEYFRGTVRDSKNLLTWKINTASTQISFNIERSVDNRNYQSINSITASNSRCEQPFDLTDNSPVAGINYYRIKMTDENGKIICSNIIALLNKKSGFEIISMAPNPVTGKTACLNVSSAQPQQINIMITDANGRSVYSIAQTAAAGSAQIEMNLSKLSKGVYDITIHTREGERKVFRFIKR